MLIYCDSSALVKLVVDEPASADLERWLTAQPDPTLISSVLARTEVVRAVARMDPTAVDVAADLLSTVTIVELDATLADQAARLGPPGLRSLDALHIAAAKRLGSAVEALVSYDGRMVDAAGQHGLAVAHPGWQPAGGGKG